MARAASTGTCGTSALRCAWWEKTFRRNWETARGRLRFPLACPSPPRPFTTETHRPSRFAFRPVDQSVVFAGDIDSTGLASLAKLAKGADLLVVSCAVLDPPESPPGLYQRHSPPKRLGETAQAAGVRALLLTHLAPAIEVKEAEVLASVQRAFSGAVTFATDGLRVPVEGSPRTKAP